MNIVVISQYWYPDENIPERRWQWLTKLLVEHGHSVTVIAPPPQNERRGNVDKHRPRKETGPCSETILRTQYIFLGPSLLQRALSQAIIGFFSITRALGAQELRGTGKPDLIIGTVPALPTAPITHIIARAIGVPFVIDLRDAWPDLLRQARQWNEGIGNFRSMHERILNSGPINIIEKIARALMYTTFRAASGMMVTSNRLERSLAENSRIHRAPKRTNIVTVRNTFPPSVREPLESSVKSLTDPPLRVLYAGKVGRAQKLDNAISALRICTHRGVPIEMCIVGEGAAFNAIRESAEDLKAHVRFHDRVPLEQMRPFYEWADTCLVHLTSWEPFERTIPSKTYELMELGKHISGCIIGEAADIIESNGAGNTVQPENPEALADLWEHLHLNRDLLQPSPKAREWVLRERLEHSPTQFLQLIESLETQK